jgi:hypothetical protein
LICGQKQIRAVPKPIFAGRDPSLRFGISDKA